MKLISPVRTVERGKSGRQIISSTNTTARFEETFTNERKGNSCFSFYVHIALTMVSDY